MMLKWFGHVGRGLEGGVPTCIGSRHEEKRRFIDVMKEGVEMGSDGPQWRPLEEAAQVPHHSCWWDFPVTSVSYIQSMKASQPVDRRENRFLPAFKFYFLSSTSCSFVGDTGDRFLKVGAGSSCGSNSFLGHMFHICCQGLM